MNIHVAIYMYCLILYLVWSMYTIWKLQKFPLMPFWQKFRESNVFTSILEVDLELVSRFFFFVREKFTFIHTVNCSYLWACIQVHSLSNDKSQMGTLYSNWKICMWQWLPNDTFIYIEWTIHSVVITKFYSHPFFAKISWNHPI